MQFILQAELGNHRRWMWRPAADIYRAGRDWLVKFDLAGVHPADVQVSLKGNYLTIRGVRRDRSIQDGHHQAYAMEILYDHFERTVELPCNIEGAAVAIECHDGMLLTYLAMESR